MKSTLLALALFLSLPLLAKVNERSENGYLEKTHTIQKLAPTVNPITGELQLEEVDLIVAGSDPLSLRRFYSHTSRYDPRYGCWRYNPETFFSANFDLGPASEHFVAVGSFDGGVTCLQNVSQTHTFTFDFSKHKESTYMPNGQTHPQNMKVEWSSHHETKERFAWMAKTADGSGAIRSYRSSQHRWHSDILVEINRYLFDLYKPTVWTPYQLDIYKRKNPMGISYVMNTHPGKMEISIHVLSC